MAHSLTSVSSFASAFKRVSVDIASYCYFSSLPSSCLSSPKKQKIYDHEHLLFQSQWNLSGIFDCPSTPPPPHLRCPLSQSLVS